MKKIEDILETAPFFEGLGKKPLRLIESCARPVSFKLRQFIFREGDPADSFYLITSGSVSIETHAPHQDLLIQTLGKGEVLGWSWLFPPCRWRFSSRALFPSEAIEVNGKKLRAQCEKDHDLGYELIKRFTRIVTERLEATRLQLLDLYDVPTQKRAVKK